MASRLAALLFGALQAACVHSTVATPNGGWPDAHLLEAVPFYGDDTDQCGPATLASVLTYWGARTEPQNLRDEVYMATLRGSLPIDLVHAAEARGFEATLRRGTLDEIKRELRAGRPVIALLELGFPRSGHYVLLTGYEEARRGLYAHSGKLPNAFFAYDRFTRAWERAGRWLVLVAPPAP